MSIDLDLRTLTLSLILYSIVFGVGTLIYGKTHKQFSGIKMIGTGHILIGAGHILLALRHIVSDFTSIVIANPLILLALIMIYRGIFVFLGIRTKLDYYFSLSLVLLLGGILYYFTFNIPDTNARIIFFSLFYSTICFIATAGLIKHQKEDHRGQIYFLIFMFISIACFYLSRGILTSFESPLDDFMKAGFLHSMTMIASKFLVILTSLITIWITTDKLQTKLSLMASTDALTHLLNRRSLEEHLTKEFSRAVRNNSHFSIIICDLDFFKKINDKYGHHIGDEVLKVAANILQNNVRKHDIAARLGGEEFVILLPETDEIGGEVVAQNIRKEIESTTIELENNQSLSFTASFGVSQYKGDVDWKVILKRADKSLYLAKEQGRNQVVLNT